MYIFIISMLYCISMDLLFFIFVLFLNFVMLLKAVGAGLVVEFVKTSRIVALIEGHEVLSPAALLAHNTHKVNIVKKKRSILSRKVFIYIYHFYWN